VYRERPSVVPGAVVWTILAGPGAPPARVLPDGCLDLICNSAGQFLVAGPDTTAHLAPDSPGVRWTGLRLPPGTGPAVLGVPALPLRDRRVPAADVWSDRSVRRLTAGADPVAGTGRWLERFAAARLAAVGGPDPLAAVLTGRLAAGASVADLAAEVALSPRHLHRRCQDLFGYGPRTLARILRMRRALALARRGVPAAEVAARTGYADQPHLSRDVRALAGVPLGVLLRAGQPAG
jgi:AraC-like DNA-binding protein